MLHVSPSRVVQRKATPKTSRAAEVIPAEAGQP